MSGVVLEHRAPITRELHAALRRQIMVGELPPGSAIAEAPLAEQLGISRTPVREVFRRLADEGLLDIRPQVGTFVAPIRLTAVHDSQFVRETLECRTVRMAAEHAVPEDDDALRSHLEQQRPLIAAGDHLVFFPFDEALHVEIIRIAGRQAIWNVIQNVKTQLDRVRYLSFQDQTWLEMVFAEHQRIVDCILRRDADGAEAIMRQHLRTVLAAIERLASERPHFFAPRR
jgi:DNA-binding GntR family transcriptional regulator